MLESNPVLKRILSNTGILLSGKALSMSFAVGSLILAARALGAKELGILTLMQSSFVLISAFFLPKPWIALVKFGAYLFNEQKWPELKTLVLYSLRIEILASIVATIVVIFGSNFIADIVGIGPEYLPYLIFYLLIIFVNIHGTPMGLLRLYNRMGWIRNIEVISAGLKLLLCIIGFIINARFAFFFIAFIASDVSRFIIAMGYAGYLYIRELKQYSSVPVERIKSETKGIGNFALSMHFNDILFSLRTELDLVVLAILLSPEAVGFYKVIKQFGRVFTFLGNPLKQAVYPDACHLWAGEKFEQFKYLLSRITLLVTIAFLVILLIVWMFEDVVINNFLGSDFLIIDTPLSIYLLFSALFLSFQIPNAALLAMGKGSTVLSIEIVMNTVYFLSIFLLVPYFQLFGVIYSYGASVLVWVLLSLYFVQYFYRRQIHQLIRA